MSEELHWYALRAFRGRVQKVRQAAEKAGYKTYVAMRREVIEQNGHKTSKDVQLIPQLLFVCCSSDWLMKYKYQEEHVNEFMIYSHKVKNNIGAEVLEPAPIPEKEMECFMFVTSTNNGEDISYYGESMPEFSEGERVRVTDGIYKGAEGIVKRIKRDRKLLVAVEGVAVVAISNIPMAYLEKIDTSLPG